MNFKFGLNSNNTKNINFVPSVKLKQIRLMSQNTGKISQIIGPVVDVTFEKQGFEMPDIFDALEIKRDDGSILVVECQQHIGERTVRTIAMDSTDGLRRGMDVLATGLPITMPIGEQIKGRLMNVTGEAIDGIGPWIKKEDIPFTENLQNMMISQQKRRFYIPELR